MNASFTPSSSGVSSVVNNITSDQACKILNISRATLHRYVRKHLLHPLRLPGGQLRFSLEDLQKVLS
jgi:excisionase family DNA binding protein